MSAGLRRLLRPLELAAHGAQLLKLPCPAPAVLVDELALDGDDPALCGAFDSSSDLGRHRCAGSSDCGEEACISPVLSTASSFWEEDEEEEEEGAVVWPLEQQPSATDCTTEPAASSAAAPHEAAPQAAPQAADRTRDEAAVDSLLARLAPLSLHSSSTRSAPAASAGSARVEADAFWSSACDDDVGGVSSSSSSDCVAAPAGDRRVCQLQRGLVQRVVPPRALSGWPWGGEQEQEEDGQGAQQAGEEEAAAPEWLARDVGALVGCVVCGALWDDDDSDDDGGGGGDCA
ncbi:hypothetical protein CHLRE_08g381850v5 [Chlamydomonas reinhardtii]|uniref:Uncharacterized protein n=1 Tax=Chlamydomonas reinhardtii TaxID=3055 RepID=A0A2K3DI32_CHLRE|nr:uncharacterized protein CHLRE_08g381850v5 [Chlamydomonas reinhardtii]PNW80191.1 hypothetical protein CHLRE_08g381850v5 [Chlamydomonas reinhardtii]